MGTVSPSASDTIAIVLAVNCPAQAPIVGRQARSSRASVASSISPVMHRADRLVGIEHRDVLPVEPAGQRAAAIDEDRRHVAADHAHHDAGQRLVAAAEADQPVIGEAVHDRLDRVGDQFARDQRELHPLVVHADAVGHRDRW